MKKKIITLLILMISQIVINNLYLKEKNVNRTNIIENNNNLKKTIQYIMEKIKDKNKDLYKNIKNEYSLFSIEETLDKIMENIEPLKSYKIKIIYLDRLKKFLESRGLNVERCDEYLYNYILLKILNSKDLKQLKILQKNFKKIENYNDKEKFIKEHEPWWENIKKNSTNEKYYYLLSYFNEINFEYVFKNEYWDMENNYLKNLNDDEIKEFFLLYEKATKEMDENINKWSPTDEEINIFYRSIEEYFNIKMYSNSHHKHLLKEYLEWKKSDPIIETYYRILGFGNGKFYINTYKMYTTILIMVLFNEINQNKFKNDDDFLLEFIEHILSKNYQYFHKKHDNKIKYKQILKNNNIKYGHVVYSFTLGSCNIYYMYDMDKSLDKIIDLIIEDKKNTPQKHIWSMESNEKNNTL